MGRRPLVLWYAVLTDLRLKKSSLFAKLIHFNKSELDLTCSVYTQACVIFLTEKC